MKKICRVLFILTILSSVLLPLQSVAATEGTPNIIVELNKSIVMSGEKITLYVNLPDTAKPISTDVELEGPPGNSYSGVLGNLQKDQTGKWFMDLPIPYDVPEGTYYIKNIEINFENGDKYTLSYEPQQNPQLQFNVLQSNAGEPVNVSIPFASNNLVVQDIIFNTVNPQDFEDTMTVNLGQNVPEGIYNIQLKAYDGENSYILFKQNYDFNAATNNITFSKEEVSHLSIDMKDSSLQVFGLNLQPKDWKSFNMTALYNNSNSVYISKMEYESLWSMFRTNDQFELDYKTSNINGNEDINLKFDTNLRADFNFEKSSYKPGETVYDFLQLKDGFGNTILFATNSNYKHVNGSIILNNETETFLAPVNPNLAYPEITLPSTPGTYNVTYENEEMPFKVESSQATIIIEGESTNSSPDVTGATASTPEIWQLNHKMVPINIMNVKDPDGDPVIITITKITQDEPVLEKGSGKIEIDGAGIGTDTAYVRAERSGKKNGRVYQITFDATDNNGNTSTGSVYVVVPHDQRSNVEIVDDGQIYDSTVSK